MKIFNSTRCEEEIENGTKLMHGNEENLLILSILYWVLFFAYVDFGIYLMSFSFKITDTRKKSLKIIISDGGLRRVITIIAVRWGH